MSQRIGLAQSREPCSLTWLPLLLYVLLRGLDATTLKWLQLNGAAHAVNGENPISFCNVFFVAQAIVGLSALLAGRTTLRRQMRSLNGQERRLLALHGVLGMFLGPIAAYLALGSLAVISQTLLFALVLPVSALLARWLLREALPRGFWISLSLILAGLLLPQVASAMGGGPMDELIGVGWAVVGVGAFAGSAITGRVVAGRGWPPAVSVGLPSTLAALAFALIAMVLYGPHHFLLLRLWWVLGVIVVYGLALSLGRELALRAAYLRLSVATVSLWGSLSILVAAGSAALVLGEMLTWPTMLGLLLVLIGVCRTGAGSNVESQSDRPVGR